MLDPKINLGQKLSMKYMTLLLLLIKLVLVLAGEHQAKPAARGLHLLSPVWGEGEEGAALRDISHTEPPVLRILYLFIKTLASGL